MFNVNSMRLNEQEKTILDRIAAHAKENPAPTITEAAAICGCSASQVSKSVKKAGFSGYKRFIHYLYFGDQPKQEPIDEIERLKHALADFDIRLVDDFASLISEHEKILLFGYGPSAICAQYFEYKLRFSSSAFVTTAPDEQSAMSMLDRSSLLAIFSTTGQYRSFERLTAEARARGADVVVVSEEFNPLLMENCNSYFVLTRHKQSDKYAPYEKTRTLFFIFIEQVTLNLLERRRSRASSATKPNETSSDS